jgi:hypothetical protein
MYLVEELSGAIMEASKPNNQGRAPGVTINVNSPNHCNIVSGDRIEISIHMGADAQRDGLGLEQLARFDESPAPGK